MSAHQIAGLESALAISNALRDRLRLENADYQMREQIAKQANDRLRARLAELESQRENWRMSSVCRELEARNARLVAALALSDEAIAHAVGTLNGVGGESQFCESCHAFERAMDWLNSWRGGARAREAIASALADNGGAPHDAPAQFSIDEIELGTSSRGAGPVPGGNTQTLRVRHKKTGATVSLEFKCGGGALIAKARAFAALSVLIGGSENPDTARIEADLMDRVGHAIGIRRGVANAPITVDQVARHFKALEETGRARLAELERPLDAHFAEYRSALRQASDLAKAETDLRKKAEARLASGPIFSEEDARTIVEMVGVCYGEGIGPDATKLLAAIARQRPRLVEEFSYLRWPKEGKA